MDLGTLGDRRQAEFDALYAEAKQMLSQSANQLKAVTERLRQSHSEELQELGRGPDEPARRSEEARLSHDGALLSRLEVVNRELEQSWRFLERGSRGTWTDSQRPGADDQDLDVSLGGVAMQMLEAREQERATVAAELHDGPAQAMANAVFQVDIIDRTLRTDPQAARTELMALRGELDRELERLRGFIHQLHPSLQGDDDLEQAIDELATRLTRESGIEVEVRLAAPLDLLDASRRRAVLRVAQEALRNVRKHASASRVRLSTFVEPGVDDGADAARWILEIADNGRGFPVDEVLDQTSKRHFGLRFMRERAQLIGARLEIASNPAVGTTVRLALEPAKRS
jgi:signal transduction histidine kinase